MKLGKPKTFGMLDHNDRCFRNVNTDFDDRGGDEHVEQVLAEAFHDVLARLAGHAAVNHADTGVLEPVGLQLALQGNGGAEIFDF